MHYLETERLLLRQWLDKDFLPFAAMNADPIVRKYFPSLLTADQSHASIKSFQEAIIQKGFGLWALELKDSGEFLGFCGLQVPSFHAHFTPCIEIGWRLAKEYWGNGYATESAKKCLSFAFKTLNVPEIVSFTAIDNWPSRRVMQRIGMQRNPQDDFEHPLVDDEHPLKKHVLYRVSKIQWIDMQKSFLNEYQL